uniref:LicD family protein n=1 Tax=Acetatifactor sp. TaxID=1872090 RepID=UPI004057697D
MSDLHMDFANGKTASPKKLDCDIAKYLQSASDDYMDDMIREDSRIQVWQQLSELRKGLISWYDFKPGAEVLEVGAGVGALTGRLCENCAHVTVTERSVFRAETLAARYKEVGNLDVYAGDVMDMTFDKKFDYILLVGILEVIGGGTSDIRVYTEYIERLKVLLKEDGRLLIAVENRYGLKYFCGAAETYTNKAFAGINHYRQRARGYTFSKKEIEDITSYAGFTKVKFYYPLPDYKMPQLIYTDAHLPEKNLKERLIPYYKRSDTLIAYEQELYNDVIENGVFPFFSNSFLVECSLGDEVGAVSYAAISTDRGKERSFVTAIYEEASEIRVKKAFLYPEGRRNADLLMENIRDLEQHGIPVVLHQQDEAGVITQPFIEWPTLSNVLKELIRTDVDKFLEVINQIYMYILESSEEVTAGENALVKRLEEEGTLKGTDSAGNGLAKLDFGPILKRAYMELIPLNCFYSIEEEKYLFFDQEFVRENYPAGYVLFRVIHYIYCFTDNAEQYYPKQKLIQKYNLQDVWDIYVKEENRFLEEVRNQKLYSQFYKWASVDYKRIQENALRLESEEEKIANYQVSDKMKKVWKIELAMLDEVDRICKKYDLTYYLVHGSLLGAVRHQGFIPWDDDLDIAMPRASYDKFLEVAEVELQEPLSIHTPLSEKDVFWGGFARIRNRMTTGMEARELNHRGNHGIWIDILPVDVCASEELFYKKSKRIRHYSRLLYAKIYGSEYERYMDMEKFSWKMYQALSKLFSHDYLAKQLDKTMRAYTDVETGEVAFFHGYDKHRRLSAKDFADVSYLDFERRKVPVPAGYENYLFMLLGRDYMKYPPESERIPKHTGIWDPEKSYTEYEDLLCDTFAGCKGKKIILFGAGMMFEDYMQKYGGKYRPEFLVDNDSNKWGRFRKGIEICSPQKILEISEEKRKLIICSYYYREISKQLDEMGIYDYKVYVQHADWIVETEKQNCL